MMRPSLTDLIPPGWVGWDDSIQDGNPREDSLEPDVVRLEIIADQDGLKIVALCEDGELAARALESLGIPTTWVQRPLCG